MLPQYCAGSNVSQAPSHSDSKLIAFSATWGQFAILFLSKSEKPLLISNPTGWKYDHGVSEKSIQKQTVLLGDSESDSKEEVGAPKSKHCR